MSKPDEKPLINESFTETMARLRALEGNEWDEVSDPLGELRKIRHGEDEDDELLEG